MAAAARAAAPARRPVPLAIGAPGEGYPCRWAVYTWLEGEAASLDHLDDRTPRRRPRGFLEALWRIDVDRGADRREHNFWRGEPLARRDEATSEGDRRASTARWTPVP